MKKVIFSWSGGKDSALALYKLLQDKTVEVVGLLTTINKNYRRVSMHGVPVELIQLQAQSIGLPLHIVYISQGTNSEYEQNMAQKLQAFKEHGISHIGFGDIFLEDLKQYREEKTTQGGLDCLFPLWEIPTQEVINEFLDLGFRTLLCSVNSELGEKFAGKELTKELIAELPENIDVCGENGEFHSFVFAGPMFQKTINVTAENIVPQHYSWKDEDGIVQSSTFYFADILLKS